jgi:dUTPase
MQLTTFKAVELGFVLDEHQEKINPIPYMNKSSFDVEVKEIIYKDDNDKVKRRPSTENLKPQNSAYLISKQYIRVPEGYIAYVFLKNRMSQRGLLALNTGIIDQNYYGPVSTLILNLSNQVTEIPNPDYPLDLSFFRIVFHKVDDTSEDLSNLKFPTKKHEYEDYISHRIKELAFLPKTFLNTNEIEERVKKAVTDKIKEYSLGRLLIYVAIVGFLFSLLSMGRDWFFTWNFDLKRFSEQTTENKYKTDSLGKELELLRREIEGLKSKKTPLATYQLNAQPATTQNMQASPDQVKAIQIDE